LTPAVNQNSAAAPNASQDDRNFTFIAPSSRRSWELFLSHVVSNLSSASARKPARQITAHANVTPITWTTATQKWSDPLAIRTTMPSANHVAKQQKQQQLQNHERRHQHTSEHRTRPRSGISRSILNLKSPPSFRIHSFEASTNEPVSKLLTATSRLPALTTPPAYLRHITSAAEDIRHYHHHHHHQQQQQHWRRIENDLTVAHNNASTTHNNRDYSASLKVLANQLSPHSLQRFLTLLTGNDANATSSSVTTADMMRYVLAQVTRFFRAGMSSVLLTILCRKCMQSIHYCIGLS